VGKWFVSYNIRGAFGIARSAAAGARRRDSLAHLPQLLIPHYVGNRPARTGKRKLTPLIQVFHPEGAYLEFQDLVRRHPI